MDSNGQRSQDTNGFHQISPIATTLTVTDMFLMIHSMLKPRQKMFFLLVFVLIHRLSSALLIY